LINATKSPEGWKIPKPVNISFDITLSNDDIVKFDLPSNAICDNSIGLGKGCIAVVDDRSGPLNTWIFGTPFLQNFYFAIDLKQNLIKFANRNKFCPPQNSTFTTQNSTFTTQNSTFITQNSTFTTHNSTFTTKNSNATTQFSKLTTQFSTATTQFSTATTKFSTATTQPPKVTTQSPEVTTESPERTRRGFGDILGNIVRGEAGGAMAGSSGLGLGLGIFGGMIIPVDEFTSQQFTTQSNTQIFTTQFNTTQIFTTQFNITQSTIQPTPTTPNAET
ncbi:23925_t:CDS:2, partial [Cetraspora pellucida]